MKVIFLAHGKPDKTKYRVQYFDYAYSTLLSLICISYKITCMTNAEKVKMAQMDCNNTFFPL